MNSIKISLRSLQVILWAIFFVAWALYTNNKWNDNTYGFASTLISIVFYIIAVYSNSLWLMPKFFKEGKIATYLLYATIFLFFLVAVRAYIESMLLMPLHKRFYDLGSPHLSLVFLTTLIAFLFGGLLFVAQNYISLLKKQEEMRMQQITAELDLLKQQVQPHFLFNTLNNIYYLAYTKNERTAEVIAKLSEIMRYFVDEAPKEKVLLSTEIQFLQNYIVLEQIRMLHPVKLDIRIEADSSLMIPPMLLIPLVENIFKHGIDKTNTENKVSISLRQTEGKIMVATFNKVNDAKAERTAGKGLQNLRKRLEIIFPGSFELQIKEEENNFNTSLTFPYEA